MTQELIVGALCVGIVGLLCALTSAMGGEDRRAEEHDRREDKPVASPVESRRAS